MISSLKSQRLTNMLLKVQPQREHSILDGPFQMIKLTCWHVTNVLRSLSEMEKLRGGGG